MKTYKHLFDNMVEPENVKEAILNAAKHKTTRRDVSKVLNDLDSHTSKVIDMLVYDTFTPPKYTLHEICEGSKHKIRYIEKPYFKYDQIIQHVLITQIKPIVMRSIHPYAHGSLVERGTLQTAKAINKWMQKDKNGTKYCCQMDIHHCYPSVDQELLTWLYHRSISDSKFNNINDKIILSCPIGLALGAPTSVWHIHFMLSRFDHFTSSLEGVDHYVRHLDDIILFGRNKKKLHAAQKKCEDYLNSELHFSLNDNHQLFPTEWTDRYGMKHGHPLDVCGYQFYKDKMILRKARMLAITRKAGKISKKTKPTYYDAEQMLSQMGWLKHSDTYEMYAEYVEPLVTKRRLRHLVSRVGRKRHKEAIAS